MSPTVTLTRDVFRYTDLSSEARDEVRMNDVCFHEWETLQCDSMIRGVLMDHGIPGNLDNCEIRFSLGYCQGDGVCFEMDRLEAGFDGPVDNEDWVDCWAGFPQRTLGADLDPDLLWFRVEQHGRSFTSGVEAFYDCDDHDQVSVCPNPLCPTQDELDKIAERVKEHLYAVCTKAYSEISNWGLEDRLDELTVFFEDDWFYEDGSAAPDPD